MNWVIAAFVASLPLLTGEAAYRWLGFKREYARKFVHVVGGVASAMLPIWLELDQISVLAGFFVLVLAMIRRTQMVQALYGIQRTSYGEVFFPAGVGLTAFIAPTAEAYVFGVLVMGFADAMAGIIGGAYGRKKFSPLFSIAEKSYVGSAAFFVTTTLIGTYFVLVVFDLGVGAVGQLALASLVLTLLEAELVLGLDNVAVPIAGAVALQIIVG